MSSKFPSIWLEIEREHERNILACGFYREWSVDGQKTNQLQLASIKELTVQLETADSENVSIVMLGDVNLCAEKWNEEGFLHKPIAEEIKGTLAQCGMINVDLGVTYLADRLSPCGEAIESALDHIYISCDLKEKSNPIRLEMTSK